MTAFGVKKGYPWPASALTHTEMAVLAGIPSSQGYVGKAGPAKGASDITANG